MRIAILEDCADDAEILQNLINAYFAERGESVRVKCFRNALEFVSNYKGEFDILFIDVQMPHMTGIEVATKIREADDRIIIIFTTSLMQYAIKGYSVNALDYIIKPVSEQRFSGVMKRALKIIADRDCQYLELSHKGVFRKININDIYYIEVHRHYLIFHTSAGNFDDLGSMNSIEQKLPRGQFSKCHNSFIVNLKHVETVAGKDVIVNDENLKLTDLYRKRFMDDLSNFISTVGR